MLFAHWTELAGIDPKVQFPSTGQSELQELLETGRGLKGVEARSATLEVEQPKTLCLESIQ